jgi:hypothetical protein
MADIGTNERRIKRQTVYAAVSFACPFLALLVALSYQTLAYSDFWESLTPEESAAAALMAIAQVMEWLVALIIGSVIGIAISLRGLYLYSQNSKATLVAALTLNCALPLVALGVLEML